MTVTLHEDQYTFLSYLAHFFLELENVQATIIEKVKTHVCSITFYPKIVPFMR
jgi:hypothetical protein